jgi:hypothetical protein
VADVPHITTEILAQIRDEMRGMRADLSERIDGLRSELSERIDGLRSELKAEMQELRTTIIRHGRVVDGTLEASLQDAGSPRRARRPSGRDRDRAARAAKSLGC